MKILVTGSCARSHAMIAKILDDPRIEKIYWAPGNVGLSSSKVEKISITPDDVETLVTFAIEQQVDFTIVSQNFALYKGFIH